MCQCSLVDILQGCCRMPLDGGTDDNPVSGVASSSTRIQNYRLAFLR